MDLVKNFGGVVEFPGFSVRAFAGQPRRILAAALLFAAGQGVDAQAGLVLTAEAPGVQATTQTNVITETFNELTPGGGTGAYGDYTTIASSIGTFTSSSGMAIVSANQYGGAGGSGNYFAVGAESHSTEATLTFSTAQSFFGFEWSAADAQNQIEFYSGSTLLASFNPTSALGALSSAYLGNPNNTSEDSGEKFAYLDVTDTSGAQITSVVFKNHNEGSGFEIDNMSISNTSSVPGGTNHIPGIDAVPEPSSFMMLGISLVVGGLGYGGSRRRVKA